MREESIVVPISFLGRTVRLLHDEEDDLVRYVSDRVYDKRWRAFWFSGFLLEAELRYFFTRLGLQAQVLLLSQFTSPVVSHTPDPLTFLSPPLIHS